MKFADDTVIVSLLNKKDTSHGPIIDHFAIWCQDASLELNASKTKDMCVDFRRNVINSLAARHFQCREPHTAKRFTAF